MNRKLMNFIADSLYGKPQVFYGGKLKRISPYAYEVMGRSHSRGGVGIGREDELEPSAEVEGKEIIDFNDRVWSKASKDYNNVSFARKVSGIHNSINKLFPKLEEEKITSSTARKMIGRKFGKLDELFERQNMVKEMKLGGYFLHGGSVQFRRSWLRDYARRYPEYSDEIIRVLNRGDLDEVNRLYEHYSGPPEYKSGGVPWGRIIGTGLGALGFLGGPALGMTTMQIGSQIGGTVDEFQKPCPPGLTRKECKDLRTNTVISGVLNSASSLAGGLSGLSGSGGSNVVSGVDTTGFTPGQVSSFAQYGGSFSGSSEEEIRKRGLSSLPYSVLLKPPYISVSSYPEEYYPDYWGNYFLRNSLLTEGEMPKFKHGGRWMQKVVKGIKARGTSGTFRAWCKKHGYSGGCDAGCIAAGKRAGGLLAKRATLAQTFCKSRKEDGGYLPIYKKGGRWIQKAVRSIKRRGTEGVCSGSKFGGPSCPPGSRRYNLAKTFRKMARARKKEFGGYLPVNINFPLF